MFFCSYLCLFYLFKLIQKCFTQWLVHKVVTELNYPGLRAYKWRQNHVNIVCNLHGKLRIKIIIHINTSDFQMIIIFCEKQQLSCVIWFLKPWLLNFGVYYTALVQKHWLILLALGLYITAHSAIYAVLGEVLE